MFSFLDCSFFERGEGREEKEYCWFVRKNKESLDEMWTCCAFRHFFLLLLFCMYFSGLLRLLSGRHLPIFLDRSSFSGSVAHLLFRKSACTCSFSSDLIDEWQWHVEKLALLEPSVAFQHLLIFVSLSPRIFLAPANSGLTLMVGDHLAPACWGCLSPARWSIQSRILIRHSSESEQAYA